MRVEVVVRAVASKQQQDEQASTSTTPTAAAALALALATLTAAPSPAAAATLLLNPTIPELAEGLEAPIQLIYLLSLLGFLGFGAYLVVRQVLIRRELDEAAKALGERIRTGEASCEDYYELGVILTRKKLYTQATKNLEKARRAWDGDEGELAQVHNALGFCYQQTGRAQAAADEYERAVALQPGYVTAWNNLGDAYEADRRWRDALRAYESALQYAPDNRVARQRFEFVRQRVANQGL
jgi:tetratricopeptide (TPR) repeat protein